MIPLVTYHAYLQISKMADNLIFLFKVCHEIEMLKFYNRLLYIVLESLSNETLKIFVAFPFKRAALVILDVDTRERSANLFKALNWLPLHDEIKIQRCCVIYNRDYGQSTQYMEQMLTRNADYGSRSNRHSKVSLVCPKYKK